LAGPGERDRAILRELQAGVRHANRDAAAGSPPATPERTRSLRERGVIAVRFWILTRRRPAAASRRSPRSQRPHPDPPSRVLAGGKQRIAIPAWPRVVLSAPSGNPADHDLGIKVRGAGQPTAPAQRRTGHMQLRKAGGPSLLRPGLAEKIRAPSRPDRSVLPLRPVIADPDVAPRCRRRLAQIAVHATPIGSIWCWPSWPDLAASGPTTVAQNHPQYPPAVLLFSHELILAPGVDSRAVVGSSLQVTSYWRHSSDDNP
jgi:hypothetical protein